MSQLEAIVNERTGRRRLARTPALAAPLLLVLLAILTWPAPPAGASADVLELKWADLRPARPKLPPKPKTFFSEVPKPGEREADPTPVAEGAFMSVKRRQPGADGAAPVMDSLNGRMVRIGGYVVPLDFEATRIKEFLLVPYVGACVHVPPPPANQIVYVTLTDPIEIKGAFDPVAVTGRLSTEPAFTGLADTGYTLAAEAVAPWQE